MNVNESTDREGSGGWSALRRARSEENMALLQDSSVKPDLPSSSYAPPVASNGGRDLERGWPHMETQGTQPHFNSYTPTPLQPALSPSPRQRIRLSTGAAAFKSFDGRQRKKEIETLPRQLLLRADDSSSDDDEESDVHHYATPGVGSINETGGGIPRSAMRTVMRAGGAARGRQPTSALKKSVAFREKAKRKRNPLREFGKHPSIPHNLDRISKLAKNAPHMVHPADVAELPTAVKRSARTFAPQDPLDRILYNEEDGMRIAGYCIGGKLQLKKIISHYLCNQKASTNLFRDCFHMRLEDMGEVFFFNYGVIICWNMLQEDEQALINEIKQFGVDPPKKVESDHFIWFLGGEETMKKPIKIIGDFIILKDPALKIRLAVSHALAQSTKLSVFEQEIEELIESSQGYAVDLARHGKISMSRDELSMKMGELFLKKNAINLHTDLLDKPEFFWEHKKLEPIYDAVHNYLDVGQRREVLNKRLGIVQELFEVLKSEKDSRHGVRLEMVVIWLIVAEAILQILGIVSEWLLANKELIL